jgi:hypothetical protein
MREDRNFRASDVSGPSIWIFILCSEERAQAVVFMSKKYDDLEVFRKQDIQQITKKLDSISKKCDEIRDR